MNRELKRVSIVVVLMFGTLFVSSTVIQSVEASSLAANPWNSRTLYESYSTERGPIVAGETEIAYSVETDDDFSYLRTYSDGKLYAPITGYFSIDQGITGVEDELNAYLSGNEDSQFFDQVVDLVTGQTPTGATVRLTIDPEVQAAAYKALGDHRGAVVALDPKTGRILALVSKPSYDPNELAVHNGATVKARYDELLAEPGRPLINRALAGDLYAPGSTMKLVVASAALESGEYSARSEFENPTRLPLPLSNATISNASGGRCTGGGSTVTLAEAVSYSCNIPIAELGMALGDDELRAMAELYGFNRSIEVPLTATASTFPADPDSAQTALSSIGQFDVRSTPLQIAMVSSAIANDGVLMQPTLIDEVVSDDFAVLEPFEEHVFSRPISAGTAQTITEMMVDSVALGIAGNARMDSVTVAGKTGTAENGTDDPYTLWFTGFAPADDPEVVVAVVIEDGGGLGQSGSGNSVAAPIAREVFEAVLNR